MSSYEELQMNKNLYKINDIENNYTETKSETIESGEISGNLTINKGFLQSKNFIEGTSGYRLNDDGIIYATGAIISGAISASTIDIGTDGFHVDVNGNMWWGSFETYDSATIKISSAGSINLTTGTFSGDLVGNTINIPDATTPLFSVDSDGNTEVASLKRNDYQWTTIFESIDGYYNSGTSSAIVNETGLRLVTEATTGSYSAISKEVSYTGFSWNKRKTLTMIISLSNFTDGTQSAWIGTGSPGYYVNPYGFGIWIDDEDVYLYTGNGSSKTNFKIGTLSIFSDNDKITIDYIPTVRCRVFINNDVLGTITTTLPSGTTDAGLLINGFCEAGENEIKTLNIRYYDFWQAL